MGSIQVANCIIYMGRAGIVGNCQDETADNYLLFSFDPYPIGLEERSLDFWPYCTVLFY